MKGRVAVVSGVGPGLGRSVALAFADAGAQVVLAARDANRLEAVAADVRARGATAVCVPTDITDASQRERLVRRAVDELGRLDALVNNAFTMGPMAKAIDLTVDDWRAAIEINLVATVALSLEAARWMIDHGGGAIVMVNSQAARRGAPRRGPYAASKAALLSAAQVLASELGPEGVRVNSVVPGQIWADSLEQHYASIAARRGTSVEDVVNRVVADIPLRRIARPEEVADAVVYLASDRASAITGQALDVNAGNWFH
jgi:NAD(P)-dependent dehydrogenase (short-subunit alcohol dehydrogenase family)